MSWRLGTLELRSRAMLAPMAGVCDSPFKRVVRHFDRDSLLSSEIVNSDALLAGDAEMLERLRLHPEEHPAALQISGHEPEPLARAAALAAAAGADLVDLNCGCPSPALVKSGNGAALMRDPSQLARLFAAVRAATPGPMSVKLRLGWDEARMTGLQVAQLAAACGADAVWIHGRTAVQGYNGRADWEAIARIKEQLSIPVIGNGDLFTPEDALAAYRLSGVDAVALGRGAMGAPWIFQQVDTLLRTGERLPDPTLGVRLMALELQLTYLVEDIGERRGVREARKHVAWYTRGLPDAHALVARVNRVTTARELGEAIAHYAATHDPGLRPAPELLGELVDAKWRRYRAPISGYNPTIPDLEDR